MLNWIFIFLLVSILFLFLSFGVSFLLKRFRKIRRRSKSIPYECGEEPHLSMPLPVKPLFIIPFIVFIIFEVELIFLFPWAINVANIHEWFYKMVGIIFIIVLFLPLILLYKWEVLGWRRGKVKIDKEVNKVPMELYEKVNKRYENR